MGGVPFWEGGLILEVSHLVGRPHFGKGGGPILGGGGGLILRKVSFLGWGSHWG